MDYSKSGGVRKDRSAPSKRHTAKGAPGPQKGEDKAALLARMKAAADKAGKKD